MAASRRFLAVLLIGCGVVFLAFAFYGMAVDDDGLLDLLIRLTPVLLVVSGGVTLWGQVATWRRDRRVEQAGT